MPQPAPRPLAFDDVVIDFAGRRLARAGIEQSLEPKAFAVLELLAGSPGTVMSRDDILDAAARSIRRPIIPARRASPSAGPQPDA